MADFVEIYEVGPRDGLQNEATMIAAKDKIRLVDLLSEAGFGILKSQVLCRLNGCRKWETQLKSWPGSPE